MWWLTLLSRLSALSARLSSLYVYFSWLFTYHLSLQLLLQLFILATTNLSIPRKYRAAMEFLHAQSLMVLVKAGVTVVGFGLLLAASLYWG